MSIGSLYHHFGGREQLIDAARVEQLRRFHHQDVVNIERLITGIMSEEELIERLEALSRSFLHPEGGEVRMQRLALLGSAVTRDALLATTREARQRTNAILIDAFQDLKDRRILSEEADPVAISLFIQAFSFGQVLADIDDLRPDPDYWRTLSQKLVLMVMHLAQPK